jgi:thioester reductase-like protein
MGVLLTGVTGYLGSYIAAELLQSSEEPLIALVRARDEAEGRRRLWQALQLHFGFERFRDLLDRRIRIVLGDLTLPRLGLSESAWRDTAAATDSIIHCAASLNRKSAKACFNVNLRGTLQVIHLARAALADGGLRRLSDVSTTAVAGRRQGEIVAEDDAVDWQRSDYDPYARTKKFAEHLVAELLPDLPTVVFRPTTVLGDSRFGATTQFDMVRAFVWLSHLPVLPFEPGCRMDIVPADYVGRAVARIHLSEAPRFDAYHLSAGRGAQTYQQICDGLVAQGHPVRPRFAPWLQRPFELAVAAGMATPRSWKIAYGASLLKVFWPYLLHDTVFDNQRTVAELGERPPRFTDYGYRLMQFALSTGFRYPYHPWPAAGDATAPGPNRG